MLNFSIFSSLHYKYLKLVFYFAFRFPTIISYLCRLQAQAHAGSFLADFSTLKMEAIRSSETSVHPRSTRRHIPEDGILYFKGGQVKEDEMS
jgi:hypothetical protein